MEWQRSFEYTRSRSRPRSHPTEVSGWWRRRLTLFHLSSIFYRLFDGAAVVVHKAALSTEPAAYRVVTPSQAFSWEISRLIEAVAILRTDSLIMLPPEGKRVTGFSVAYGSLQHGYQRLTMICASLRSFATAVTDSRQFARRYAPSNCVRWCNSCSLL